MNDVPEVTREKWVSQDERIAVLTAERAAAYARGFAAGLEQAAGVCDAEAANWEEQGIPDFRRASEYCAAAIRRLAAPPAAGVDDGGKVDA